MILHDLRRTSSRIEKEAILAKAEYHDKEMFKAAYNPDINYGLKFSYVSMDTIQEYTNFDDYLLYNLANKKLVGNTAREEVMRHCAKHGDLVKLICNKDLDCGITATTLNNVFGDGFIPTFKVQLATEVPIEKVPLPIWGQIKYDGVRVVAILTNETVMLKTRNGKQFKYPLLEELLHTLPLNYGSIILDGELTIGDSSKSNHTTISGIVNSAIQGTPIVQDNIVFTIFDTMSYDEFSKQKCDKPYLYRFNTLKYIIATYYQVAEEPVTKLIQIAHTYDFSTHTQINEVFERLLASGYEGLILKKAFHKYSFKRSKDWIKVKAIKTADLVCTGSIDGTGKYINGIGALSCEGQIEGKQIKVNVGSGLSDSDRYLDAENYIDKTIEIKYNSVIQDKKTGEWSLFLPRFVQVRFDK